MAINCINNLSSYYLPCREAAGVYDLFGRGWSASTNYTYDTLGIITGGTTGTIYNFQQNAETAEFHPGVLQQSNSTVSYNQTLNFELNQYQASLRTIAISLAKAQMEFFVQTEAGKYFVVGEEKGALLQENDLSVGKELNSLNGGTFNFLAKAQTPAREMSAAAFAMFTQA